MERTNLLIILIFGVLPAFQAAPDIDQRETLLKSESKICETPECISAALLIQSYINATVNPCDDFFKFACGGYLNTIEPKVHLLTKVQQNIHKQIQTRLESGFTDVHPQAFMIMKSYYDTCMNKDQIESTAEEEFRDILEYLGGWPVLEGQSWNESNFKWTDVIYKARKLGYSANYFFSFNIITDPNNSSRRMIEIAPLTGSHVYYLKRGLEDEITRAYYKYMTQVADALGGDWNEIRTQLNESLSLEVGLYAKNSSDELYNLPELMTVQELEENYPSIPWSEYFNELLSPHANIQVDEAVRVKSSDYFDKMSQLLNGQSKRVLANYIFWRVTMESIPFLTEELQQARNEFLNLNGSSNADRSTICLSSIWKHFEIAVSSLYVREYFDESVMDGVTELLKNVREGLKLILSKAQWIKTERDRVALLEKVKKITPHLAYPKEVWEDEKIDNYYEDLILNDDSFLISSLNLSLFSNEKVVKNFRERIDNTDWITHTKSASVNAFYNKYENSITIPAGILQEEFFAIGKPNYLNYGILGSILGHEMAHGFDSDGIRYGEEGEYESWWPYLFWRTKWSHADIYRCMKYQGNEYTVEQVNLTVRGSATLDENIADNIGLMQAYKAYVHWEERNYIEPQLPGLPYTSRQMFWISTATTWCAKQTDEDLRNMMLTDEHAPSEFRVNGPRANMNEFFDDFNCPKESRMDREKKCQYW